MPTDSHRELPEDFSHRTPSGASAEWRQRDHRFKNFIETPGRLLSIGGLLGGLVLAVMFGLLVGQTQLSTVILLSGALVFVFLLIGAGEYWWGILVVIAALSLRSASLGFQMSGFEMGFVAVAAAYLIRSALRAMPKFRPFVGIGLPFWVLFVFLLIHFVLLFTYSRYESPQILKNITRGYYSAIAPLAFFYLLGKHCEPSTVRPVTIILVAVTGFTTLIAIPIFLLKIQFPFADDLPVSFQWLDPELVGANLRSAPMLTALAVALWPTMTTRPRGWIMVALIGLSFLAGAASSGRLAFAGVFLVLLLYFALNRNWILLTGAAFSLVVLTTAITLRPETLDSLPRTAMRALSPLNLGESHIHDDNELSNRWHHEIRADSLAYWTESYPAFFFGHGFGGWDYSLSGDEQWTRNFEYAKKMAIRMGKTENAFSAITNIFGLTGLLLYLWLIWRTTRELFRARKVTPPRSFARAMCEVSLISIAVFLVLAPFAGGIPSWDIFYWQLGLLAARPFLKDAPEAVADPAIAAPLTTAPSTVAPPRPRPQPGRFHPAPAARVKPRLS